jgi:hypothetical protein
MNKHSLSEQRQQGKKHFKIEDVIPKEDNKQHGRKHITAPPHEEVSVWHQKKRIEEPKRIEKQKIPSPLTLKKLQSNGAITQFEKGTLGHIDGKQYVVDLTPP